MTYIFCDEGERLRAEWVEDYNRAARLPGDEWRQMLFGPNDFIKHKRECKICSTAAVAQKVIEGAIEFKDADDNWLDEPKD